MNDCSLAICHLPSKTNHSLLVTHHSPLTTGLGLQGLLSHFFSFRSTLKLINIILFGLVQTKPVQSKTASLGPSPVRPSGGTGPERALPQTGSVRTGGIIAYDSKLVFVYIRGE